jgi:hypothetical protein
LCYANGPKSLFENSSGRLFLILFLVLLDFLRKRRRKRKK